MLLMENVPSVAVFLTKVKSKMKQKVMSVDGQHRLVVELIYMSPVPITLLVLTIHIHINNMYSCRCADVPNLLKYLFLANVVTYNCNLESNVCFKNNNRTLYQHYVYMGLIQSCLVPLITQSSLTMIKQLYGVERLANLICIRSIVFSFKVSFISLSQKTSLISHTEGFWQISSPIKQLT